MKKKALGVSLIVAILLAVIPAAKIANAGGGTTYWSIGGVDNTGGGALALDGASLTQLQGSDDVKLAHDYFWPQGGYDESRYLEFDFGKQASTFSKNYRIKSAKIHLEFTTNNYPLDGAKIEVFDASGGVHQHALNMPAVGQDMQQDIDISSYMSREKGKDFKVRFLAFSHGGPTETLFDEVRLDLKIKKKETKKVAREITNSKNSVFRGQVLVQKGFRFSKNSDVNVYFSKPDGTYFAPMMVKANKYGNFTISYLANKPKGDYKWYAVDLKTGKKSKTIHYKVK